MMRPTVLVPLLAGVIAVAAFVIQPWGGRKTDETIRPPVSASLHEPGVQGKPNPYLGYLQLEAIERPSPDRAWVRARWTRAEGAHGCRLDVIVPEGATLLSGAASIAVEDDAQVGEATWLVDFPTGRDLDLTVRFCGTNERGDEAMEAYLRLTSAP